MSVRVAALAMPGNEVDSYAAPNLGSVKLIVVKRV
jgi:hypothetical protein